MTVLMLFFLISCSMFGSQDSYRPISYQVVPSIVSQNTNNSHQNNVEKLAQGSNNYQRTIEELKQCNQKNSQLIDVLSNWLQVLQKRIENIEDTLRATNGRVFETFVSQDARMNQHEQKIAILTDCVTEIAKADSLEDD